MATSENTDRRNELTDQRESATECPIVVVRFESSRGETVCVECWLILDDQPIDTDSEFRRHDDH